MSITEDDYFTPVAKATTDTLRCCHDDLAVLVYLARCDGDYHPEEIAAIVEYVESQADGNIDRTAVIRHVRGINPDACWDELDRLAKRAAGDIDNFNRFLKRVLDAKGYISKEKFDFIIEVQQAFEAHGKTVAVDECRSDVCHQRVVAPPGSWRSARSVCSPGAPEFSCPAFQ